MSMWKKSDEEQALKLETPSAAITPMQKLKDRAVIGHTISIKGEIAGDEDLEVHGRVEGNILLDSNNVTIGESGQVKADVAAKIISIEGSVEGNLRGAEQVVIRQSGNVRGNISAPRVTLEDGCKFTGSIDMEGQKKGVASSPKPKAAESDGRVSHGQATLHGGGSSPS